ncbi:MAG: SGNH/GDSL hydrolase family protein [bacterium]|nr:SGNH/GDSL hydrolase family protein [bacterium]
MNQDIQELLLDAVQNGLVNRGNWERMKRCIRKADCGEPVTVGFIGGSITQDAGATIHENCYAYRVYQWWKKQFPKSRITYVNAGIGATTSHFGVARVQTDLLYAKPDFVVVEFSVNDNDIDGIDETDFFRETYEGLIRRIYGAECEPAVLLVHNVRYHDGSSAEDFHLEIGRAYELPCVSMRKTVYPLIEQGIIKASDISEDNLHPNDLGHQALARLITSFLETVSEEEHVKESGLEVQKHMLPEQTVTQNTYEHAMCLRNASCEVHPVICEKNGFVVDEKEREAVRDIFRSGWIAATVGDSIIFHVTGQNIAIQYRKSIRRPTPVAQVIVDGDEEHAMILDGNFDQDWGDKLQLDQVMHHGTSGDHQVEVRIIQAEKTDQAPFYLASVITAG